MSWWASNNLRTKKKKKKNYEQGPIHIFDMFCRVLVLVSKWSDFLPFLYRWWPRAVWGTLCVCWRFSPGTGEREPSSPSQGPWHTGQTLPCIPEADGDGTGRGGASAKNTAAPGSTHPTEQKHKHEEEETDEEMVYDSQWQGIILKWYKSKPWKTKNHVVSYIDDESAQLILLQRDYFVVAGLLCQLQQGARRCQPQPRHVWFTGGRDGGQKK